MGPHRCGGNFWKRHSRNPDNYICMLEEEMGLKKCKCCGQFLPRKTYQKPAIVYYGTKMRTLVKIEKPHKDMSPIFTITTECMLIEKQGVG
jgi:NAD-dependent SIR2 family protein deacetylase